MIVWNLWSEIISLCKFSVSGGLPLQTWAIFDPFWPLGSPKKSQHLWFVQNEWKYKICDQKLCLCANFQLLGVIFWEMENFWPFCPHWPLGCPKSVKRCDLTNINTTIKFLMENFSCSISCTIERFNWIMVKIQPSFKYSEFHINYFTIFSLMTTLSYDVTKLLQCKGIFLSHVKWRHVCR